MDQNVSNLPLFLARNMTKNHFAHRRHLERVAVSGEGHFAHRRHLERSAVSGERVINDNVAPVCGYQCRFGGGNGFFNPFAGADAHFG